MIKFFFSLYFIIYFVSCINGTITDEVNSKNNGVEWYFTQQVTSNQSIILWKCKSASKSSLILSSPTGLSFHTIPIESQENILNLPNLLPNTQYNYIIACDNDLNDQTSFTGGGVFNTIPNNDEWKVIYSRSVWVIGGFDQTNRLISQIDIFDPLTQIWYPGVYSLRTPRAFSGSRLIQNRLIVFGGIVEVSSGLYSSTNSVEELNLDSGEWRNLNVMPTSLQGFNFGFSADEIFLLGGSTSLDISTSTLTDTVYKFNPNLSSNGRWDTLISLNPISRKINSGSCSLNGDIFIFGGRLSSSGNSLATSDVYNTSSNSMTSDITETSLGNPKMGIATVCYQPSSTDPFPEDLKAIVLVGGTNSPTVNSPPSITNTSQNSEYYLPNNSIVNPNTIQFISPIPIGLAFGSISPSYSTREILYFGGKTNNNEATDNVYSLDMSNPILASWKTYSKMPRKRYGHDTKTFRF